MSIEDEKTEEFTPEQRILQAINDLSNTFNERMDILNGKFDSLKNDTEVQFEAIRTGLVANSAAFDRLQAKVLNMNATLTELQEEFRQQNRGSEMSA